MYEMCYDDILDWAYNTMDATDDEMDYLFDQAACLDDYIPLEYYYLILNYINIFLNMKFLNNSPYVWDTSYVNNCTGK